VGPLPISRNGNKRVSTAETHLDPVRWRPNLTVRAHATVDRLLLDGTRVTGVLLTDGTVIEGGRVILTAGAIQDPAILQRSGIGPAEELERLGITPVVDLPVGDNLADHWAVPLLAAPAEGAWSPDFHAHQTLARRSSAVNPGSADIQYTMYSYLNLATGAGGDVNTRGLAGLAVEGLDHVAGVGCILQKPYSVGTVRITSTDPNALPAVDPNYMGDERDREVARECVRGGWEIVNTDPLAGLLGEIIGLDQEAVDSDELLDERIDSMTASGYHFAGSCRMAPRENGGVVDEEGRVYGIDNLRIADASVMPTIPSANTMLPTIMVAERLGQAARDGRLS
jgi:choline dehydrogenase